jgi:hypothetical protein
MEYCFCCSKKKTTDNRLPKGLSKEKKGGLVALLSSSVKTGIIPYKDLV